MNEHGTKKRFCSRAKHSENELNQEAKQHNRGFWVVLYIVPFYVVKCWNFAFLLHNSWKRAHSIIKINNWFLHVTKTHRNDQHSKRALRWHEGREVGENIWRRKQGVGRCKSQVSRSLRVNYLVNTKPVNVYTTTSTIGHRYASQIPNPCAINFIQFFMDHFCLFVNLPRHRTPESIFSQSISIWNRFVQKIFFLSSETNFRLSGSIFYSWDELVFFVG